jgi:DNA-binding NarL/FixJ family response regulator
MPAQPLRIVLVEDSVLLREGLVRLFDEAGYITAGAFGDADDIVARVRSAGADVAILDVRLPPSFRDEGIKAALLLRAQLPELGILGLSQYVEGVYARELLAAGDGGVG